jgi:hypothetical protein
MTPGCKVHTVVKLDVLETMTHNTQVLRATIFSTVKESSIKL